MRPHGRSINQFNRPWIGSIVCVFMCFVAAASVPSGENADHVSVRVLDAATGRPIKGASLLLGVPPGNKNENRLRDETDSEGSATFHLVDPIPERISLIIGPEIELCPQTAFVTEQILATGVVADDKCKGPRFKFNGSPKPGELVVFVRRVSVWERMIREL
jgi:hypothetical protein